MLPKGLKFGKTGFACSMTAPKFQGKHDAKTEPAAAMAAVEKLMEIPGFP